MIGNDRRIRARDIMARDLVTITPETPILDVHRLFVEEEIHGAPVVGEDGIVYGVVSALDLARVVRDALEPDAGGTPTSLGELSAADAMTKELVMIEPDTPVDELARTMLDQHVHRVLVGRDRVLEGVVTTFDLLRVLAAERTPLRAQPSSMKRTGYSY
jgi:CBS domain-containing protein